MNFHFARIGLVAIALAVPLLSGCSSLQQRGVATSSTAQIADISQYGNYNAATSLKEARSHFKERNFGYSAAFYKRYVELAPQDAGGYVGLGASYDRLGRFDLSDRVYASLLRVDGESAQYFNNVGYSQMLRGNLMEALNNFRKAQALAPDSLIIQNNIQLLADAAQA